MVLLDVLDLLKTLYFRLPFWLFYSWISIHVPRLTLHTAVCEFTSPFHGCTVRNSVPLVLFQSCFTHNLLDYRLECEALRAQTVCVLALMEGLKGVSSVLL